MAQAPATRDNQGDNVDKRASNEEHSCAQEVQGPFPRNSWLDLMTTVPSERGQRQRAKWLILEAAGGLHVWYFSGGQ